jgi:Zn-dependent protease
MENFLLKLSIMLVPGLMAITCHEVSHGYIAYLRGDNTAKRLGRLTLNPLKHIDLLGTVILPLMCLYLGGVIFGWAKPVPVDFSNLRKPKRDMIWVSAAGPITNILLATASALLLRGLIVIGDSFGSNILLSVFIEPVTMMLAFSVYMNLVLAIFNMIPVLPLDGGRVMVGLLPNRLSIAYAGMERYGMLIIFAIVLFFPAVLSHFIGPILYLGLNLLIGAKYIGLLSMHL